MFQKNWNPWPIIIGHGGRNDRHCRILSNNYVMEVIHAGN